MASDPASTPSPAAERMDGLESSSNQGWNMIYRTPSSLSFLEANLSSGEKEDILGSILNSVSWFHSSLFWYLKLHKSCAKSLPRLPPHIPQCPVSQTGCPPQISSRLGFISPLLPAASQLDGIRSDKPSIPSSLPSCLHPFPPALFPSGNVYALPGLMSLRDRQYCKF